MESQVSEQTLANGYQPESPEFPEPDLVILPVVQLIPLYTPDMGWWKRFWTLLTKRPKYIVKQDYFLFIEEANGWMWIPKNFVYDFASIPKLIPFINPAGLFAYPATPHDCNYRFGCLIISAGPGEDFVPMPFTRKESDHIFFRMARKANKLSFLSWFSTGLLRVFGGRRYASRNIMTVDWSKPVH